MMLTILKSIAKHMLAFALLSCFYRGLLMKLRKLAWINATSSDPEQHPSIDEERCHLLDDVKRGGLPSSGGPTSYEVIYWYLYQWPIYAISFARFVFVELPLHMPGMVLSKLNHGYYFAHSEQDIVDSILSIPSLYMMCEAIDQCVPRRHFARRYYKENAIDQAWLFVIPETLPGESTSEHIIHNDLSIVFLQNGRRLIHVKYQGKALDLALQSSLNLIYSLTMSASNNWTHFKCHLMAELSAKEIIDHRIKELEPSALFVNVLHSGLLNSPTSPAIESSPLFAISVTQQCFEERFKCDMPHYLDIKRKKPCRK